MCLLVNSKIKRSLFNKRVYKILDYEVFSSAPGEVKYRFISPYRTSIYEKGSLVEEKEFSTYKTYPGEIVFRNKMPKDCKSIDKGLHAYQTLNRAKKALQNFDNCIIVKCVIPRFTPYINGTAEEIVSLKLLPVKAITQKRSLNAPDLVSIFNGE